MTSFILTDEDLSDDELDALEVPYELLRLGTQRMASALLLFVPADVASERANNIAAALAYRDANPRKVIPSMLEAWIGHLSWGERTLCVARVLDSWLTATTPKPFLEANPQPMEATC